MCQFCKRLFEEDIDCAFCFRALVIEYAGKLYHKQPCFAKVEDIARRTGGVL